MKKGLTNRCVSLFLDGKIKRKFSGPKYREKTSFPWTAKPRLVSHCTLGARGGSSKKRMCAWERVCAVLKTETEEKSLVGTYAVYRSGAGLPGNTLSSCLLHHTATAAKCCRILRLYWLNQMFNIRTQACTRVHTPRADSQLAVHVVLPGEQQSQAFCNPDVSWKLGEPPSS